jgi:hypothetical protein
MKAAPTGLDFFKTGFPDNAAVQAGLSDNVRDAFAAVTQPYQPPALYFDRSV